MIDCPIKGEKDQTVYSVALTDYLEWVSCSDGGKSDSPMAIPPIQRGFVWKPKQIQDLWDSLMRGMPIGSFLVQRFESGENIGSINDVGREQKRSTKGGWYLLDGQQRTLSMLLGFSEAERKHKLWVDFSESGSDSAAFQFRVTTEYQPFGYRPNGSRKLSISDRKSARERWGKEEASNQYIFKHDETKPWKANENLEEYIFEVSKLWEWMKASNLKDWKNKVVDQIKADPVEKCTEERIDAFGKGLLSIQQQWLALIEVKCDSIQEQTMSGSEQDFLTLLFERVSRGGTQLSLDDLLFSLLKQQWSDAHNLVYSLQKEVGVMMSPTDFVMTAFRLAATKAEGIGDFRQPPKALDFHKHLNPLLGSSQEPGELKKMIEGGKLKNAFKNLMDVLLYKKEGDNDIGFPHALLPYLERSLLQVLLYWCVDRAAGDVQEQRNPLICFALFWMVSRPSGGRSTRDVYKASVRAIENLKDKKEFPIHELYKLLAFPLEKEESIFQPLVVPPGKLGLQADRFRKPDEREKHFFGESGARLYYQFNSRKHLLLWFQRSWVDEKYGGVDFLSGQDEDVVPYDFDHLIPQSSWSSFRGRPGDIKELSGTTEMFRNNWARSTFTNSIGNYRVMDASENRRRGDTPLSDKGEFLDSKGIWNDYAFSLAGNEETCWRKASRSGSESKNWNDERVMAFQYAVESRVLYLYERLYEEAGFEKLLKP